MLMKFLSHEIVMLHLMTLLHFWYLDFHQTNRHTMLKNDRNNDPEAYLYLF